MSRRVSNGHRLCVLVWFDFAFVLFCFVFLCCSGLFVFVLFCFCFWLVLIRFGSVSCVLFCMCLFCLALFRFASFHFVWFCFPRTFPPVIVCFVHVFVSGFPGT